MRTEDEELAEDARAARLLAHLPPVGATELQRVRGRVLATTRSGSRATGLRLVGVATGAAALAAAALFGIRTSLEPQPVEPVAVAAALHAPGAWAVENSIPNVGLSYDGEGDLGGTSDAPRIRWEAGTLNVEVVPDRGVRLSVETPEAEVRVVGTGFTVERDALGTRVEVRHGRVEVDCGAEVTRLLREGDTVTCLPRTAGGLLGRALALQAQNAPGEEILSVLERALALPDVSTSHADELGAHRVRVLLSLHRDAEALEAARRYLGGAPGLRRQAVERYAATAAVRLGGCATVVPWLDSPSVQDICAP